MKDEWWYLIDQTPTSTSAEVIVALINSGMIPRNTLVWHRSTGDWIPAENSPLSIKFFKSEMFEIPSEKITVVPIITNPDNSIAWVIAASPFFLILFPGALKFVAIILGLIVTLLCVYDARRLVTSGVDKRHVAHPFWGFLCPAIYLFIRAIRLRQTPTYAIAWFVIFIMSVALSAPLNEFATRNHFTILDSQ